MQRLVLVLVLLAVGGVGLGFYMGWFHLGSDDADGKSNVTLSVDKEKFKEDRDKAVANVQDAVGRHSKDKVVGTSKDTMDGKVVSIGVDKLTMTDKEGKEHSHTLAPDVRITCDGKDCTAIDLKAGMRIRVTTEAAGRHAATRIEALDASETFASSQPVKVDRPE